MEFYFVQKPDTVRIRIAWKGSHTRPFPDHIASVARMVYTAGYENLNWFIENVDVVPFKYEDGSTTEVKLDVVNNSLLLRTALSDVSTGDEGMLSLPKGVLQQWLQCVGEEPFVLQLLKV